MRLWDVQTGTSIRELTNHTERVGSVAISPDGKTLASGSVDDTVRLWDVQTGTSIRELTGHTNNIGSVVFSPKGKVLASGSWDNTIRLWDVQTGTHLSTLPGHTDSVTSLMFSPDGKTIASGSFDGTVSVMGNSHLNDSLKLTPIGRRVCKVFCHSRKRLAEPLLQRSNMSIEKDCQRAALQRSAMSIL